MALTVPRHTRFPSSSEASATSSVTEDYYDMCRSLTEEPYIPCQWNEEDATEHYTAYAKTMNVWHVRLLMDAGKTEELRYVGLPRDPNPSGDAKFSGTAVPSNYGFRMFVGQVKREITAYQLRYLLRAATGVTPRMVRAKEGHMCWLVVVDTYDEFRAITAKNRQILCDMEGAFVDDSADGSVLRNYCNALKQQALSYGHSYVLPRNAIVIEQEDARHGHHGQHHARPVKTTHTYHC